MELSSAVPLERTVQPRAGWLGAHLVHRMVGCWVELRVVLMAYKRDTMLAVMWVYEQVVTMVW